MSDVRFVLDGETIVLADVDPTGTLLDLLRYRLRRTGTKEGCSEGDCGACTVLIGDLLAGDRISWRAVNACILFLPMINGKALLTVESLSTSATLHPIQQAMVDHHGSQCGFCTPGIVMSLYGRSIGACGTKGRGAGDVLAGNLCRCTGYGPILAAAEAIAPERRDDARTVAALKALRRSGSIGGEYADPLSGTARRWYRPTTTDALAELLLAHPDAQVVAGATDVGLWVTKQHRVLDTVVFIGDVAELSTIEEMDDGLQVGAGVRYAAAAEALSRLAPDLGELLRRIGGPQIRNAGTIGGNVANGSPIGDMPPALIALGATVTLRRGRDRRTLPLEDFFVAYGVQDRLPGEFVESLFIPRPATGSRIAISKLSKRFDSDISAVLGAFAVNCEGGTIRDARLAFGGMAATPKRALAAERSMIGRPWSEATIEAAAAALSEDFSPLSDVRGSSAYRLAVAGNLLRRMWFRERGEAVSVLEMADG